MNKKTILITDNETGDILCIIKTINEGETWAAINRVIDRLPGAWSLEDILEELCNKYHFLCFTPEIPDSVRHGNNLKITDIMTDFSTISV